MKRRMKTIGFLLGIVILFIIFMILVFSYQTHYKKTEITEFRSKDKQYALKMFQIGEPQWPFGAVNGRFELKREGKVINSIGFSVADDGAGLAYNMPVVFWKDDCVKIRVSGSEQDDMMYTLYYNGDSRGEKAGPWFTDEEVVEWIQSTYGDDVIFVRKNETEYVFCAQVSLPKEGSFEFSVEQGEGNLLDNYWNVYYRFIGECFF